MDFVHFVFSSFWHFVGFWVLIWAVGGSLSLVIGALRGGA